MPALVLLSLCTVTATCLSSGMMFAKLCLSANMCEDESAPGPLECVVLDFLVHAAHVLHVLVLEQSHTILQRQHVNLGTRPLRRLCDNCVEGVLLSTPAVVALDRPDGHTVWPVRVPGRQRA
jgi:hypothetical protein